VDRYVRSSISTNLFGSGAVATRPIPPAGKEQLDQIFGTVPNVKINHNCPSRVAAFGASRSLLPARRCRPSRELPFARALPPVSVFRKRATEKVNKR